MIDDDQVQAALDYLKDHATDAAQATADRRHLEEFRKAKLAMIASGIDGSEAARDRAAHAHPEYQEFLEGLREAVKRDEWHRHQRKRAELICEVYRTQSATMRAMKL